MMSLIKKYGPVMVVFGVVLAAVLFRAFSLSGFRYDASARAEASANGHNIISAAGAENKYLNALIVDFGPEFSNIDDNSAGYLRISPDSLLTSDNFSKIRKHEGPVLLRSSDPATAARLWMIISQKGIRNVFILRDSSDLKK